MKTRFILDAPQEMEVTILAINSHVKGYKLCWNINSTLKVSFEKQEDHNIQNELWFASYFYVCDQGVEYNLLANRSKNGYLIPSQKSVNFFLLIKNDYWAQDKKEFIAKLSMTKDILLVFELNTDLVKDLDRLI